MNLPNLIIQLGFSISLLVNAALFIPQIISILRHKNVESISLMTFAGFNLIQLFTMLHGFIEADYLLAFGSLLSFLTCGAVTFLIIYFRFLKK